MRITKAFAEEMTALVFKPSYEKADDMIIAHNDMCYDLYLKTLPKDLEEVLKKHSAYIGHTHSALSHTNVKHVSSLYVKLKTGKQYLVLSQYPFSYLDHYKIKEEESKMILDSYNEINKYRKSIDDKAIELYDTLIGLKTKKKVLEVMPQLEKYFPKDVQATNYPMIINPELINVIANQPM